MMPITPIVNIAVLEPEMEIQITTISKMLILLYFSGRNLAFLIEYTINGMLAHKEATNPTGFSKVPVIIKYLLQGTTSIA